MWILQGIGTFSQTYDSNYDIYLTAAASLSSYPITGTSQGQPLSPCVSIFTTTAYKATTMKLCSCQTSLNWKGLSLEKILAQKSLIKNNQKQNPPVLDSTKSLPSPFFYFHKDP